MSREHERRVMAAMGVIPSTPPPAEQTRDQRGRFTTVDTPRVTLNGGNYAPPFAPRNHVAEHNRLVVALATNNPSLISPLTLPLEQDQ
jgi:hypothetical protein